MSTRTLSKQPSVSNFHSARVIPNQIHKEGYLIKLGGVRDGKNGNWKKRYMVLKDDLAYYEDHQTYTTGKPPKGIIKLDSFLITKKDGENLKNEFTLFAVPKPLVCRAESREELDAWYKKLSRLGH